MERIEGGDRGRGRGVRARVRTWPKAQPRYNAGEPEGTGHGQHGRCGGLLHREQGRRGGATTHREGVDGKLVRVVGEASVEDIEADP